jgi:hypothetical protein
VEGGVEVGALDVQGGVEGGLGGFGVDEAAGEEEADGGGGRGVAVFGVFFVVFGGTVGACFVAVVVVLRFGSEVVPDHEADVGG